LLAPPVTTPPVTPPPVTPPTAPSITLVTVPSIITPTGPPTSPPTTVAPIVAITTVAPTVAPTALPTATPVTSTHAGDEGEHKEEYVEIDGPEEQAGSKIPLELTTPYIPKMTTMEYEGDHQQEQQRQEREDQQRQEQERKEQERQEQQDQQRQQQPPPQLPTTKKRKRDTNRVKKSATQKAKRPCPLSKIAASQMEEGRDDKTTPRIANGSTITKKGKKKSTEQNSFPSPAPTKSKTTRSAQKLKKVQCKIACKESTSPDANSAMTKVPSKTKIPPWWLWLFLCGKLKDGSSISTSINCYNNKNQEAKAYRHGVAFPPEQKLLISPGIYVNKVNRIARYGAPSPDARHYIIFNGSKLIDLLGNCPE